MNAFTTIADPSVLEWANLRDAHLQNREPGVGASRALSQEIAPTIEGVIAKLRSALHNSTLDPRVEGAVLCEAPLSSFDFVRREALLNDDYENECIWMAIASLEQMQAQRATHDDLVAEFVAAEARCKLDDADDDELAARNEALYAVIGRVQALPNTPENLAIRARAICSAVDYTGIAAEMTLSELSAHAESNAGELVREILACLLGQPLEPVDKPPRGDQ